VTDTLSVLRRIASDRPARPAGERCDMCVAPIADEHSHVVDIRNRALMCTCRPCALLFDRQGADLAFRTVPDRYLRFPDFALSQGQWDDLAVPVGVAFFFSHSTLGKVVAFYPSPAGATESELPLDAWDGIVAANPALDILVDDVEALLLRKRDDDIECFLVPIDACYELVGHLRRLWRGFDGGSDVHARLEEFFDDVAARSRPA
jgi:Family of unknown function (DUF5947)